MKSDPWGIPPFRVKFSSEVDGTGYPVRWRTIHPRLAIGLEALKFADVVAGRSKKAGYVTVVDRCGRRTWTRRASGRASE